MGSRDGEQKRGGNSLIYGVFGDVDKEEGEHIREEQVSSSTEVLTEA